MEAVQVRIMGGLYDPYGDALDTCFSNIKTAYIGKEWLSMYLCVRLETFWRTYE